MNADPTNSNAEWFTRPDPGRGIDGDGLRFTCTMCGNCCSGPEGYVLVSDAEAEALARRLGLSIDEFLARYTHHTRQGRSLTEVRADAGFDCVFLDRTTIPGKAICGVYEDRPAQCRTWPFWPSVLRSAESWARASRVCPGLNKGHKHTLVEIRIARDSFKI